MRHFMPSMRRRHHPLARLLAAVLGVAVLGFMFVFGLLAMGLFLVVGVVLLAMRQWRLHRSGSTRPQGKPATPPGVIEGEFVVVQSRHQTTH